MDNSMKTNNRKYLAVCLVLITLLLAMMYQINANQVSGDPSSSKAAGEIMELGDLEFHTSLKQASRLAKDTDKMLFVYLRSETCGWCKKFESESFMDKDITALLNEHFVLVTIDVYKQKDIATKLGVRGTPSSVFFDAAGKEILRIPGYEESPEFLKDIQKLTNGTS